ncbi:MAG: type II toxin-antitoxin system VapC family toxin [Puniceicoccaceae bacterium]
MARRYLLDTSVFSQPLRRKPVPDVLQKWRAVGDEACAISIVTLAEMEFGLELEKQTSRKAKFEALLRYRLPVLPTDEAVWSQFSRMKARQQAKGEPVGDMDLLIAATAVHHKLCVATLNRNDFSRIESLSWEDWSK